jgi:hypothetical protein
MESIDHILASCSYTREIWHNILLVLHRPFPELASTTYTWWKHIRAGSSDLQRAGMDSLFVLVSWQVWKERNARCFRGSSASVAELLQLIKDEGDRWIQAGALGLGSLVGR